MKKTEYFALTGEIIEREMTPEEIEEIQNSIVAYEQSKLDEIEIKAQAKQELLKKLGITAEEAQLLLS